MKLIESSSANATTNQFGCYVSSPVRGGAHKFVTDEDEGVCDLDLDDFTPVARPRTPTRVASRPMKLRAASRGESMQVKEKLITLTQTKLKSVEGSNTADGLRNKVLLESALKRCLTQTSAEKRNKLALHIDTAMTDVNYAAATSLSDLAYSNDTPLASRSAPCSPRKRSSDFSSAMSDAHSAESPVKRRRQCHFEENMDILMDDLCDTSSISRKDDLFADLANVFYRLKTQQ